MPIALILNLVRYVVVPLLAISIIFIFGRGYQKSIDDVTLQNFKDGVQMAELKANAENYAKEKNLKASTQIIEDLSNENLANIKALSVSNSALLTIRLQREKTARDSRTMPENTTPKQSCTDTGITGYGAFLEAHGASLIQSATLADELTESLRACRSEYQNLEKTYNGEKK